MIPIEKGVPIPPRCKVGGRAKYPWQAMEIGDSFVFPDNVRHPHNIASITSTRLGKVFRVRSCPDGKTRAWRTA